MPTSRPARPAKIIREPDMRFPSRAAAVGPRAHLATLVDAALAATLDLHRQVERAHWSVTAWQRASRHELFDRLALHLVGWIDLLAIRAATLGLRRAPAEPVSEPLDGELSPEVLVARYRELATTMRALVIQAAADAVTADVLAEIAEGAELDAGHLAQQAAGAPFHPSLVE